MKISPKTKRMLLWISLAGGLFLLVVLFTDTDKIKRINDYATIDHILIDDDTERLGLETLNVKLLQLQEEQLKNSRTMSKLQTSVNNPYSQKKSPDNALKEQLSNETKKRLAIESQLKALEKSMESLKSDLTKEIYSATNSGAGPNGIPVSVISGGQGVENENNSNTERGGVRSNVNPNINNSTSRDQQSTEHTEESTEDVDELSSESLFNSSEININPRNRASEPNIRSHTSNNINTGNGSVSGSTTTTTTAAPKSKRRVAAEIRTIAQEKSEIEENDDIKEISTKSEKEEIASIRIPAGSIFSGVLIAGLDAPTHEDARRDPHPALMRISKEAILPNNHSADFRECFVLFSGYGDLSSERAYLRAETISCVRDDKGVVESTINAYALGEDGKAGVRGRVVNKQGQIIIRSLMAGFAEGVSEAFSSTSTTTEDSVYASIINPDTVNSGLLKGSQSAMSKIADYYLKIADKLFPIIEIGAGREVEMILTNSIELKYVPTEI